MAKTLAQQLDEVQTAITAVLAGSQSYQIDGQSVTRADLKDLYNREDQLERRIARAAAGSRTVAEF